MKQEIILKQSSSMFGVNVTTANTINKWQAKTVKDSRNILYTILDRRELYNINLIEIIINVDV